MLYHSILYPSIYSAITIPEHWYKLVVWCENGKMEAEYIFSDHVDNNKVSETNMYMYNTIAENYKNTCTCCTM